MCWLDWKQKKLKKQNFWRLALFVSFVAPETSLEQKDHNS